MRIKELRKKNKVSQLQLAKLLNTTQANVSSWEKEKWQPDTDNIVKMANYFNCSVDFLLGREEIEQEKKQPEQVELEIEDDLTDKQKELLNIIKNMNNDDVNKVIGYAYSLNEKELSTEEKIEKLLKEYKNKN